MLSAGIDVGSSSVKVTVMAHDPEARILEKSMVRYRKRDPRAVVGQTVEDCLKQAGVTWGELDYAATTGEGDMAPRRHGHFYGMTTHARGALYLAPECRSVLDCGALHARAIRIDERGRVLSYRMTSQCASGSGQFIENIARYLGVALEDVGSLSLSAPQPEKVSGICAVLAETDVINMVARGIEASAILRGIHASVANRLAKLLRLCKVESPCCVTGGLSADAGLIGELGRHLEGKRPIEVIAPPDAIYAGAIGAAIWGAFRARRMRAEVA